MLLAPLALTEELDAMRASARAFSVREIAARGAEAERTQTFRRDPFRTAGRH